MNLQDGLATRKTEIKDAISVLGKRMSCTPAQVNTLIKRVRKEQTEPGFIEYEEKLLAAAKQVAVE